MATKAEKIQRAQELLTEEGATFEAVTDKLVAEFEVKENTAQGYIEEAQEQADTPPAETPNNNETAAFHKDGYEVPDNEKSDVHVCICLEGFDAKTGTRLHNPFISKYDTRGGWQQFLQFGKRLGYELIEYLYVPKGIEMPEKL